MIVLILNHYEHISPRVANEIKILSSDGYKVKILYWDRGGSIYEDNKDNKDNKTYNKTIRICFRAPKGSFLLLFYIFLFYIESIKSLKHETFDIVHCTHFYLLPLALILKKWKKVKVVYDAYEMYSYDFSTYVPKFLSKFIKSIVEALENYLVSKVDGLLTIDSIENFLVSKYSKYNKNVVVLYNVPDKEPEIDLEKLKEFKSKYNGRKILIYVGGIYDAKGSIKALEALTFVKRRFPEVKLLMIGNIFDPISKIESIIEKLELKNNVEFIPWLPYEEMFYFLKISHIALALYQPKGHFLLVSRGNARKIFTYMQAALPIVAPNFGEIGLVVKEEGCGILVDTTRSEEIAEAIVYLLEHPEEAKAMGKRGRRAIEEKYNWEMEKKKLLSVYHNLLIGE